MTAQPPLIKPSPFEYALLQYEKALQTGECRTFSAWLLEKHMEEKETIADRLERIKMNLLQSSKEYELAEQLLKELKK